MRRIEGHRFGKPETMLFEHARCGHAGIACGEDRPSAGKSDPMRARQVKPVKADREEEIEHHLSAAHGDDSARRQNPGGDLFPSRATRVPPPTVRALLKAGRLA